MIFGFFKKRPPKAAKAKAQKAEVVEEVIGKVTHYFSHCKAAVMKLERPLNVGDTIHIKGHTTDFNQKISSMQIDGKPITGGKKGEEIGLLVKSKVRSTDTVYKEST